MLVPRLDLPNEDYPYALSLHLLGNVLLALRWGVRDDFLDPLESLVGSRLLYKGEVSVDQFGVRPRLNGEKLRRLVAAEVRQARTLLAGGQFVEIQRLQAFCRELGLSPLAASILGVIHLTYYSADFRDALGPLGWETYGYQARVQGARVLSLLLAVPLGDIHHELRVEAPLRRHGLVNLDRMDLPVPVHEYLDGFDEGPLDKLVASLREASVDKTGRKS